MHRIPYFFNEFKSIYFNKNYGWVPVYSSLDEDDFGRPFKILKIDMICEWRLSDGKLNFVQVAFNNQEEYNQLIDWLRNGANYLNAEIMKRIKTLEDKYDF